MPRFEWPWVLLLLLAAPLLLRRARRDAGGALGFNRVHPNPPRSARERWLPLLGVLRMLAIAVLIVTLAGPRVSGRRMREISKTIGLQLVLDCSGSMAARDMDYDGKQMSRIDVVRELSRAFIFGDAGLPGRPQDMIGVIGFAEEPVTLCPLTLAHETLRPVIDTIHIGAHADGTAIGDALAVAAARMRQAETGAGEPFRSKAIILVTDGDNNSGSRTPEEAAQLAAQWGVRVYIVGIRPDTTADRSMNEDPARKTLTAVANATGGIASMVSDGAALREVYRKIDQLERSDREVPRFTGGWEWIYGLLALALLLLSVELVLSQTWLRRLP
jgi:Ca-activated chloride channel homolog